MELRDVFTSDRAPEPCEVNVVERQGCDPNPLDPTSAEGRLTLLQFIWADQTARAELLDRAIQVARQVPCQVVQANALDWLPRVLAQPSPGAAKVLFHSVVWQYISHEERAQLTGIIEHACANATAAAPFAWLRMEPGKDGAEVQLRIAPGFEDQIIATAGYHVPRVQWIGPSA